MQKKEGVGNFRDWKREKGLFRSDIYISENFEGDYSSLTVCAGFWGGGQGGENND